MFTVVGTQCREKSSHGHSCLRQRSHQENTEWWEDMLLDMTMSCVCKEMSPVLPPRKNPPCYSVCAEGQISCSSPALLCRAVMCKHHFWKRLLTFFPLPLMGQNTTEGEGEIGGPHCFESLWRKSSMKHFIPALQSHMGAMQTQHIWVALRWPSSGPWKSPRTKVSHWTMNSHSQTQQREQETPDVCPAAHAERYSCQEHLLVVWEDIRVAATYLYMLSPRLQAYFLQVPSFSCSMYKWKVLMQQVPVVLRVITVCVIWV